MRLFLSFLLILISCGPACAWEARLVHAADGDSFTVRRSNGGQVKVRLYGIDAPEKGQAWNRASGQNLSRLLKGVLDIEPQYYDPYGRVVAVVRVKGKTETVNEQQIADGMAWLYPQFCKAGFCRQWREIEKKARQEKRGLWSEGKPIAPWDWKHPRRK